MTGKAKSLAQKTREAREAHDLLMARAIALYQQEQQKPVHEKRKGLRTICKVVEIEHRKATGKSITLNHNTLRNLANGGRSKADFNATKAWLTQAEEKNIVGIVKEYGEWGFPVTHRRLKELVDEVCRTRLGDKFPVGGVGVNYTHRFMERNAAELSTYWAHHLESKRGGAVNPTSNEAWFKLLGETLQTGDNGQPLAQDCIWAVDETGFQPSGGARETVIGAAGKKTQYQQRDGNRENITVLVTIGADGSSIPPAVIFKGKAYQTKWKQDNPADASIGYSKKGWTDGEIGVEWIKQFDKQTREKAAGRWRLLLVDGHNSHYTRGFLEYARTHQIHVLCYPAHGTHIYQGLDVAVFSVLKLYWSQERDQHERETGETITKENFLAIYGRAHLRALQPEIIGAAFRKTGVWPYNPNVVTEAMMAPSRATQWKRDTLPLPPPTPVRIVSNLIHNLTLKNDGQPTFLTTISESSDQEPDASSDTTSTRPTSTPETPLRAAMERLASSDARFLVSSSPVRSEEILPHPDVTQISPTVPHYTDLTRSIPSTVLEENLQIALCESQAREQYWKSRTVDLQSGFVLQELYCKKVRRQLAQKEKRNGKGRSQRLNGDGMPRLLTSNDFYDRVIDHEETAIREEEEKAARRDARESRSKAMALWRKKDDQRKARNKKKMEQWEKDVHLWEAERDLAKVERRRRHWNKPPKPKAEKSAPKPKAQSNDTSTQSAGAGLDAENDSEVIDLPDDEDQWETSDSGSEED